MLERLDETAASSGHIEQPIWTLHTEKLKLKGKRAEIVFPKKKKKSEYACIKN
jgi:hypothetical protein